MCDLPAFTINMMHTEKLTIMKHFTMLFQQLLASQIVKQDKEMYI